MIFIFSINLTTQYDPTNAAKVYHGLLGEVKSVAEYEYAISAKERQIVRFRRSMPNYPDFSCAVIWEFNKAGCTSGFIDYCDETQHRYVYYFDSLGFDTLCVVFRMDGVEFSREAIVYNSDYTERKWPRSIERYNDKGELTYYKTILDGSSLHFEYTYEYDSSGLLFLTTFLEPDGRPKSTEKKFYDGNGLLIRSISYNSEGVAFMQVQYMNDSLGNVIEAVTIDQHGKVTDHWKYYYKYDLQNNWTAKLSVSHQDEKPTYCYVQERRITYYD